MINWIRSLFCLHKWEEIYNDKAHWANGGTRSGIWTTILFKCDKCGSMKKVILLIG